MAGPKATSTAAVLESERIASVPTDCAKICAVYIHSTPLHATPRARAWTTVNLKIDYLRPLPGSGPVRCVGRRTGIADAEILDADGRVCARGSSTCLIVRGGSV